MSKTKKEYNKQYFQREEVKENNASRMKDFYYTEDGQKYEHKKRRTPKSRFTRGRRHSVVRRKKEWTITLEEYEKIISNPCHYCGKDISQETGHGLDRIDNDKGYHADNVHPCCARCNRSRARTMAAAEFKRQSKLNRGGES